MKKIVIATDAWEPQINGVVRCVEELKFNLEKKGFEVFIIHPRLFFVLPNIFYPEVRLSCFSKSKIKKIISDQKTEYVHIITEGSIGLATRSVCLEKKIKFTTSYHTHFPYYASYYNKIKVGSSMLFSVIYAYLKWFHNASDATMFCAKELGQELEKHGFKKLCFWPLGIDTELFKNDPQIAKDKNNFLHPVFLYFGRISKEKNVEEFLNCDLSGTKVIIGDGPQKKYLEKKYSKSAKFLGYKKGKELVKLISNSDVFVFPSRTDTFGLVIIEALACGVPVAAHDVMGPKDIITDGVDGFLDENLERAALNCLNINRENCRKKALDFSLEKSADYFISNLVKN